MPSELKYARQLVRNVRFCDDRLGEREFGHPQQSTTIKNSFYCNELEISEQVTPALNHSFIQVLGRLKIPRSAVEAFVYASPEMNAQCFTGMESECVIRLSSALIEILTPGEVEFVIGHELGHFLLSHEGLPQAGSNESLEGYIQYRAQEISADRVGVIAAGSVEVALKAMLKTVSGLSNQHLRFDISKFISQIRSAQGTVSQHAQSTHPSVLVRGRALLWFSMSGCDLSSGLEGFQGAATESIDRRVRADMDQYVDGEAKQRLSDARMELAMWLCADNIVRSGSFSKADQKRFQSEFGKNMLSKLSSFLQGQSVEENKAAVGEKLNQAKAQLESLMPLSFQVEYSRLLAKYQ